MSDELTAQEIFDTVARHLIKQGKQSRDAYAEHLCAYRGVDGASCAVGCLISDEEYTVRMESLSATGLISHDMMPQRLRNHESLLGELQRIHDHAKGEDFRGFVAAHMRDSAIRRGLSAAVLDEAAHV